MARNGSGTYSRPEADYVFNTVIDETKVNNELDQIATALTDSIAKDGQTNPTANLPMNSKKHTGVAAGTARTDYADVASVQDGGYLWGGTGGGTADVITITMSPAITAHTTGQKIAFLSSGANTTNVTLNPNSIGAKAITKDGATALVAGDIPNAAIVVVQYDGTQYQILNTAVSSKISNILDGTTDFTKLDVDNLTLDGNAITSTDTAGDITVTPDTTGDLVLDGLKWPQADGTANQVLTTDGAAQLSWGTVIPTGTVAPYIAVSAPTGWILLDGGTIGNAASGGTTRANADTATLFALYWDNMADAQAPVSSGRGGSAAADFAANKTITISDMTGFFPGGTGGTAMATHGDTGGAETHTLIESEMPSHDHDINYFTSGAGNTGVNGAAGVPSITLTGQWSDPMMDNTGGDGAHNNMPPWVALTYIVKL